MASSLRQDKHIARLDTPGERDKLVLTSFECIEGVSELFEYRVDALSREGNIDFDSMLGRNCTVTFNTQDGGKRFFDGIMAEAQWLGPTSGSRKDAEEHAYSLVLRPWLWLLSFRHNCLIFHEKTAPKIIEQIFGKHGFADFKNNLSRDYPKLEYCVQYRESDMAFVCRLMEQHGISYYFEHSEGAHKLILADEASTFKAIDGGSRRFCPAPGLCRLARKPFHSFDPEAALHLRQGQAEGLRFQEALRRSHCRQRSATPSSRTASSKSTTIPGKYVERADGVELRDVAAQHGTRASTVIFKPTGDCVSCFPGALVSLTGHPIGKLNQEYLALRCVHTFQRADTIGSSGAAGGDRLRGPLRAHQERQAVRAAEADRKACHRRRRRPRRWSATARSTSTNTDASWSGSTGTPRKTSRCGCRVAQVWAGKQWGGIFIPRVGMEVVVQFLEGDPDQPLVIGAVYNNENMPPFKLPDNKTIAGIKSNSSTGGGGYNEFIFEDKAGKELVRMNAQKDLKSTVENDETRSIANNRSTSVGGNDTLNVGDTLSITAGNKVEITVGASKITMDPEKITIESLKIEINAHAT